MHLNPSTISMSMKMNKAALTKQQIRSKILFRLKTQKEEDRNKKSNAIARKLFGLKLFKKAKVVMFYVSFDGEVNTEDMIEKARKLGKIIALPACNARKCMIAPCAYGHSMPLRRGLYGILEPQVKKPMPVEQVDLLIVPGVAFDKKGNRLGRGKGYYDRFLNTLNPDTPRIGLAFDFQILPSLPITSADVPVNRVLFA